MKRVLKFFVGIVWRLCLSLAFTYWWIRHPDAIPAPPDSFSIWLTDLASAHDCEAVADVETLYMLVVSFLAISVVTVLVRWGLRRLRRARAAPS